jgi:hypothetical protein
MPMNRFSHNFDNPETTLETDFLAVSERIFLADVAAHQQKQEERELKAELTAADFACEKIAKGGIEQRIVQATGEYLREFRAALKAETEAYIREQLMICETRNDAIRLYALLGPQRSAA